MIYLKTPAEIEKMQAACELTSRVLGEMAKWVKPGVTTHKIDSVAKEYILDNGGRPACLGYGGFPGAVCIEVNEVVVHGFPSSWMLLLSLTVSMATCVILSLWVKLTRR